MGADEAVPVVAVKELEPCHVGLNNGGTAELTRFEQDGADGLAGGALTLKDAGDDALWTVEAQTHVGIAGFVFDGDTRGTPILEVVALA